MSFILIIFFTSYQLLTDLKNKNVRACGTVRQNRTNRCPLEDNKSFQKKERGSLDYRSDGNVLCVKWNDNSVVTLATNYYGVNPMNKVERNVKNKGKVKVNQPNLIKMYNSGMGGVDTCDHLLSAYRPRLRSKKWWWNLFSHALNLSVVAAYKFYITVNRGSKMTHIQSRREVSRTLITRQADRFRLGGPTASPAIDVRFDGINHFLNSCTQCRCVVCQKNTRLSCDKCNKRLHKVCSTIYHTR